MQVERDEPVIQDQALGELSQMFLSNPSDPTPGGEALDVSRFDFTMESLGAMDEHLERMRTRQLSDRDWNVFILRSGAYVGEVIRRFTPSPKQWHWLDYEDAATLQPFVASLGNRIETAAVLWDGPDDASAMKRKKPLTCNHKGGAVKVITTLTELPGQNSDQHRLFRSGSFHLP